MVRLNGRESGDRLADADRQEATVQLASAGTPDEAYQPEGGESRVNMSTEGFHGSPLITPLASGGYLVLWGYSGANGTYTQGQIFNSAGLRVGGELTLNGEAAAALPGGGFVTAWTQYAGPGGGFNTMVQIYDAFGAAVGAQFSTGNPNARTQQYPSIAVLASGGFSISWSEETNPSDSRTYSQIFASTGSPVTDPFLVSSGRGREPEAATLTSGNFVVAWEAGGPIMAQIYTPAGVRYGTEFQVSSLSGSLLEIHVAALAGGGFVVTYVRSASGYPGIERLSAQVFDADGAKVGGEILVAANPARPVGTDVAALPWGGFIVSWTGEEDSDPATFDSGIRAQVFDAAGQAVDNIIVVNQTTAGDQSDSDVAVLANGEIVFGWRDGSSNFNIKSRTYALPDPPTEGDDILTGGAGANVIDGLGGNDQIYGLDGDDILTGGAGTDRLDGGAGADTADYSIETGGGGIIVNLSAGPVFRFNQTAIQPGQALDSYGNVETLVSVENFKTGSGDDQVRGDAAANRFETGGGSDILFGGGGADYLAGGGGNDQYYVYAADSATFEDVIVELADGGFDQIRTTLASFSLAGLPEVESLFGIVNIAFTLTGNDRDNYIIGNNSADTLEGGLGNDKLEGGGGNDTMRGGLGDDEYIVTEIGDVVEENGGEGIDLVWTTLATYSLAGTNIENLFAFSTIAHDFRGNAADNVIIGSAGNDILRLYDGGDDMVQGGGGSDNIFFIGSLTSADAVSGGSGTDTLVLQGAYGALTLTADITEIENVSLLAGSNANFGEPGTNRYDYAITTNDANFAAGIQARINGAALLAGEDFTFDGSAETDAKFVVYGGNGVDSLTGGLGNDIFFYAEERFATGDTVNGGPGYDGMFLRGNYTIDFNAPGYTGLFTNIENLTLTSATDERYARGGGTEFDYNLVLSDAIVKPGETLTVSGALLMTTETMILDASQEADGLLRLFGGRANDTLKGGANADLIHGNLGGDILTGNGGADVFRYDSTAESSFSSTDQITDFTPGTDKVDLSRIDANTLAAGDQAFAWIGSSAFSGTAGELRASAFMGNAWILEGDTDGNGQPDLFLVLALQGQTPLGAGDFLL